MDAKDLVMIVEDDDAIVSVLEIALAQHRFATLIARDIKEATRLLRTNSPELILLDLGLPDGDGKNLLKTIRRSLATPVIILSARNEEREIVTCLEWGADDYVTKPFSAGELIARVRAARRRFLALPPQTSLIGCGEMALDLDRHLAFKGEVPLKLTPTEFNLLRYFLLNPNRVLTHQQILKEVWGVGYQNEMQYLRTFINGLRKKIEHNTSDPKFIQTELGIGYRFACPDDERQAAR